MVNPSDPHVLNPFATSLLGPLAGPLGSSVSGALGVENGTFAGTITEPLNIDVSVSDEDGDTADLSGDSTIAITGDGHGGVTFAANITLNQDAPIQPHDSLFPVDYSGPYVITGTGSYIGGGYFGGPTFYVQGAHGLIMQSTDWSIFVNPDGGDSGGPYATMTADLQQYEVAPGGFGITASGNLYAAPGV
jgi:hypothetical protein